MDQSKMGTDWTDKEILLCPPSDIEIRRHIEKLNSLKEGEKAVANLIACGQPAIEPLRQFLLGGKPSAVYHSRRWAVEALAALGAKDILLEYLQQKKDIHDPAVRLGEEAVESAAARELRRWPSEKVYQVLLGLIQEHFLPGAIETLGDFQRPEAVSYLLKALEDDVYRRFAEDALRKIGPRAKPDLIRVALTPQISDGVEIPSSLLCRRSACRLLAEIGISADEWEELRPLLAEPDAGIIVALFRIAEAAAGEKDQERARRRLIEIIPKADWFGRFEIQNALMDHFDALQPFVEEEILRRQQLAEGKDFVDPVLATLLRVKRRTERTAASQKTARN
jgi:HEAT repeat protein